jgi:hypothetical protein
MILDITNGKVKIDKEDLELVSTLKWHVNSSGYAVWRGVKDGKKQTIRMHRMITNCPKNKIVDHINHDRLDNRRSNLRICTQSDNMRNMKDQGKGYWYQKQNNNWVVEIYGKHRGCFDTESEAKQFAELVRMGKADKKPKAVRTHCNYGHSLDDAYYYSGIKYCRKCQSIRSKEYYGRKTKRQMVKNNG